MSTESSPDPYIIAPNSAEPWPQDIWDRIDLDELEGTVRRINEHEARATSEELERYTSHRGFYIPQSDRDLLRRIGTPATEQALRRLS